jgi:hypothetical protein
LNSRDSVLTLEDRSADSGQHPREPSAELLRPLGVMTNERKIWEAALLLVRRHGTGAAEIAQREAQRLRGGEDQLTCVVWCWIARSAAELLRPFPEEGEMVH